MPLEIPRNRYVALFGPTVGDKIRLADTDLIIEIEKDLLKYGDEVVFGGGKSARDSCGQISGVSCKESLDLVITNAIVLDPILGILKADIGIKDGLIVGVGNAGNPNIMDDIDMLISSNTEIVSGEHTICTPGTIDTHIHFVSPQQAIEAICKRAPRRGAWSWWWNRCPWRCRPARPSGSTSRRSPAPGTGTGCRSASPSTCRGAPRPRRRGGRARSG